MGTLASGRLGDEHVFGAVIDVDVRILTWAGVDVIVDLLTAVVATNVTGVIFFGLDPAD